MDNKIEVLESSTTQINPDKVKKNPLAVNKKKTVKRSAQDVYPDQKRKGLNKIEKIGKNPLDRLFHVIETKLEGSIDDLSLDVLFERVRDANQEIDEFSKRYSVIEKLMNFLIEIQDLSIINSKKSEDTNLISISLHDIKTFSKLTNLVIIHGIYPALGNLNIGIPLDKRRLNEFSKTKKRIKIDKLPKNSTNGANEFHNEEVLLSLIYKKFLKIFLFDSDVKDLLLRGTGIFDFLTITLTLACVPYFSKEVRENTELEFNTTVVRIPDTYELFQTYSLLLSSPSQAYFKTYILSKLQLLHYNAPRNDGLISLIEFVLGLRDNEDINIEKFDNVANVVLSKPKNINTVSYFTSIGNQCYDLLININKPTVTSCVGYIIERLWSKNRLVAQDFVFKKIWNNFDPIDISDSEVIVSEVQLNNAINVILSLTKKSTIPEFLSHLISPILLSLWSYYVFLNVNGKNSEVVSGIIVSFLTLTKELYFKDSKDLVSLNSISKNIMSEGGDKWDFKIGPNGLVQIIKKLSGITNASRDQRLNKFFTDIDKFCDCFLNILSNLDDSMINSIFITILKRYLKEGNNNSLSNNEDPYFVLIDLRLLESICKKFKEDLAKTPLELIDLVKSLLASYNPASRIVSPLKISVNEDEADSDDEDEEEEIASNSDLIPTVLELLSVILSESDGKFDDESIKLLRDIMTYLNRIGKDEENSISNASKALRDRIEQLLEGEKPANTIIDEHKKILKRAITSLNDPLVPIRAHGLFLLRQLVEANSDVISLDFAIELHLNQLNDLEPFIYLNVIKGLESLLYWNESEVLPVLISIYLDEEKRSGLDERLRIGEVILRFVQRSNELFSGNSASMIANATLKLVRTSSSTDSIDDRLRMSSMSLLGMCCKVNPLGIVDDLENALDCALGILQLETGKDSSIMRRSAIILIHDLILGVSNIDSFQFPSKYRETVVNTLNYIAQTDNDLLVREQAKKVLETIQELVQEALSLLQEEIEDSYYKMFQLDIK